MVEELEEQKTGNTAVLTLEEVSPEGQTDRRRTTDTRTSTKTRHAPNYHVIIWNDEEHSYEYVVDLLMRLFGHSAEKALKITTEVDKVGKGIAHTCHQELAELKRDQILAFGPDHTMAASKSSIRATIEPVPE